ncbi:MAG: hypothetical protein R3B38_01655 [Patescibacteria group bacterium]
MLIGSSGVLGVPKHAINAIELLASILWTQYDLGGISHGRSNRSVMLDAARAMLKITGYSGFSRPTPNDLSGKQIAPILTQWSWQIQPLVFEHMHEIHKANLEHISDNDLGILMLASLCSCCIDWQEIHEHDWSYWLDEQTAISNLLPTQLHGYISIEFRERIHTEACRRQYILPMQLSNLGLD